MENLQTGPRTSAGKQTSWQNSTRHGCTSTATLILPTESVADFRALESTWLSRFAPKDGIELELLHQVITADWLLRRSTRTLTDIEAQIFAAEPNPLLWTPEHHAALARFQRYRTANQNAFTKHGRALEDYRRQRNSEVQQEGRLTIAQTA